ncbi:hypothetical protein RchiOBHm_Chr5g0061251 [Rosa chinensis]|uniref:Uncharacterized protein n=1 Tax=Rosa chinensis TaxID=74649 RepID=A0A2P6QHX1_ROSCH|nr:hypothetical protein RchiOBHm_Chr5g0061251 [Rosa chinensis]
MASTRGICYGNFLVVQLALAVVLVSSMRDYTFLVDLCVMFSNDIWVLLSLVCVFCSINKLDS